MIWDTASDLWEEPTTLEAISTHLCYWVTSSFAFFFILICAEMLSDKISSSGLDNINFWFRWSNLFLNIFSILIIFEVSSYIAKAYWDYRRDNL